MLGKAELVAAVQARIPELSRRRAAELVEAVIRVVIEALARDERATIPGFGSFIVLTTGRRKGRNPAIGQSITIRPAKTVRFLFRKERPARDRKPSGPPRGSVLTRRRPLDRGEGLEVLPINPQPGDGGGRPLGYSVEDFYGTDRSPATIRGPSIDSPSEIPRYAVVEVFYATDRKPVPVQAPPKGYGPQPGDGRLRYGSCRVSIPHDHRMGRLESPNLLRFELRQDPEKHVILLSVEETDEESFLARLRTGIGPGRQILVFVHGFKVTFDDAARRTAQIAYDLCFDGAAICYSWPSRGGLLRYAQDEDSALWTVPHLGSLLTTLARDSGAERIHVIAHSMGNRALTDALRDIAVTMAKDAPPQFTEVILTAPDINVDVFRRLADAMRPAARHLTLYASANDRALQTSKRINGYPRAGDVSPDIVVMGGLDTIDASAVDTSLVGHSYYGDNRSVLSDMFYLLRGTPPDGRAGLRVRKSKGRKYWAFVP